MYIYVEAQATYICMNEYCAKKNIRESPNRALASIQALTDFSVYRKNSM